MRVQPKLERGEQKHKTLSGLLFFALTAELGAGYRYMLAYGGGLPGPMIEDLRRGRRYDGPEYYDEKSGRWRQGYPHQHHLHREQVQLRRHGSGR